MSIEPDYAGHVAVSACVDDLLAIAKMWGDRLDRDDLDALYEAVRTLDYLSRRLRPRLEGKPERSGGAPAPLG